jgi:hypothetical protein
MLQTAHDHGYAIVLALPWFVGLGLTAAVAVAGVVLALNYVLEQLHKLLIWMIGRGR